MYDAGIDLIFRIVCCQQAHTWPASTVAADKVMSHSDDTRTVMCRWNGSLYVCLFQCLWEGSPNELKVGFG